MHGYAITAQIQEVAEDLLRVEEGSLYPALHRMEQAGWLRSEWGTTERNREARFYSLTAAGRNRLAHAKRHPVAVELSLALAGAKATVKQVLAT